MTRKTLWIVTLLLVLGSLPSIASGRATEEQVVKTANSVMSEVMQIPGRAIPHSLLSKAAGVAIIPNLVKGGFVVGVRHGRGVMLVRDEQGFWQPPMFISLTGGSIGWQVGIQSTDLILVFRTKRSVNGLMSGKLTIGADAAAAAGPIGRKAAASTDAALAAEILSYSKSRGLFAGVSIDGSVIQVDQQAAASYYRPQAGLPGTPVASTMPASAIQLINTVAKYTTAPPVASIAPAEAALPLEGLPAPQPQPQPAPQFVPAQNTLGTQLQGAERQLMGIIEDPMWKSFLQIPTDPAGGPTHDAPRLQQALQRYDAVSADPRYATLARRPEFANTHQLLRNFVAAQTLGTASSLNLPPPPFSGAPTRR